MIARLDTTPLSRAVVLAATLRAENRLNGLGERRALEAATVRAAILTGVRLPVLRDAMLRRDNTDEHNALADRCAGVAL